MNNDEKKFQTWLEDNAVVHLGDYLYLFKEGEYTLNQLRSIYKLEKSIQPTELYFPAGFFED
jgi:hypothetical protein